MQRLSAPNRRRCDGFSQRARQVISGQRRRESKFKRRQRKMCPQHPSDRDPSRCCRLRQPIAPSWFSHRRRQRPAKVRRQPHDQSRRQFSQFRRLGPRRGRGKSGVLGAQRRRHRHHRQHPSCSPRVGHGQLNHPFSGATKPKVKRSRRHLVDLRGPGMSYRGGVLNRAAMSGHVVWQVARTRASRGIF